MSDISVIIPVYNAERVLRRCLDSIKAQTFLSWTAVCVDDGSTDSSPAILDGYAAEDSRFVVLHKINGGVGAARNAALPYVDGKYVLYVDSDDFLHPRTMEICFLFASANDADIVAFTYDRKFRTVSTVRNFLRLPDKKISSFPSYDIRSIEALVTDDIWSYATEYSVPDRWAVKHCQPWRCLYRTGLVKDVPFLEGVIYEDFPWWSEILLSVRKAVIINLPLYYYYPSFAGYIMSSGQQKRIESLMKCLSYADERMKAKASGRQYECWERNFRNPFFEKFQKKTKRYG